MSASASAGEAGGGVSNAAALAILVVDDHPANLQATEAVLRPLGYTILLARGAEEAWKIAEQQELALILADVRMPDIDGFAFVAELRRRGAATRTPIVFLSAYGNESEHAERAYDLGALDYIIKPIAPKILRAKVQAHIAFYLQTRDLQRRNEAIGILGHDLRNPLSVLTIGLQSLFRASQTPDAHRATLERLSRATHRMRAMVDEILDFTRFNLGEPPLSPAVDDLAALCRDLVEDFRSLHPARTIALDASGDLSGKWDRNRLAQALANLLSNALEHGDGAVTVTARPAQDLLSLAVHNGGDPIPSELLQHLFEPFHRSSPRSRGLGLGLYIARQVIRAHGGSIGVRSAASEGTVFQVLLPRSPPDRPPTHERSHRSAAPTTAEHGQPLTDAV